jgi:hypothetical protein
LPERELCRGTIEREPGTTALQHLTLGGRAALCVVADPASRPAGMRVLVG